jgi:hypothetical protein
LLLDFRSSSFLQNLSDKNLFIQLYLKHERQGKKLLRKSDLREIMQIFLAPFAQKMFDFLKGIN